MKIIINEYKGYSRDEIYPLYERAGWTNYTSNEKMLEAAYLNSALILAAYDGDKLVGIIRVVGDGHSIIFIQDIIVLPEYQRRGIGTMLMRTILERYAEVYQIELATDNTEKTIAFYKSLGFHEMSDMGCAAFIRIKSGRPTG